MPKDKDESFTMRSLYDWMLAWDATTLAGAEKSGKPVSLRTCTQTPGDVLYVPAGMFLATKVVEGSLIYGVRKSRVVATPETLQSLEACVQLYSRAGKDVVRMQQIVALLRQELELFHAMTS